MKFLIHKENNLVEEIDAIANGLAGCGQTVLAFSNIYLAYEQQKPDYILMAGSENKDVREFLKTGKIKVLNLSAEQISSENPKFTLDIPRFASTLKYKPQLPSKELTTDIALIFDGNRPELIKHIYGLYHKTHKVKIFGAPIDCPGYIGLGSHQDFVKLAKSSKVTFALNNVIVNSLLYNNIFAVNNVMAIKSLSMDAKEKESTILEEKKNIITDITLGKLILEKLSNTN